MMKKRFIVKGFKSNNGCSKLKLDDNREIQLRPYIYVKNGDTLEFIPSILNFKKIFKIFQDKDTNEVKKIKIYPAYERKEIIYIPPHKFEVVFRERRNAKDLDEVRELEKFHYRGKGLNKIVGRRTVLLAEMKNFGIVGYGVLSASVAVAGPRFKLLNTNFKMQMRDRLINRIIRIPRIVIHPEFRGMHLGVLMSKHLVNYAKNYWDINHYTPIMIEVIAAMTDYHRFFEKAGFIKVGYTSGYKGKAIMPQYGKGSFLPRNPSNYNFMINQKQKPYCVYPLSTDIKRKLKIYRNSSPISFLPKLPKLKNPIKFEKLSLQYKTKNSSTKRTNLVKDVFGVDSEQAFSLIIRDFSLLIEPGDVVMLTGASGSGKSTILKLLTTKRSTLKDTMKWYGTFPIIRSEKINMLNTRFGQCRPLIDQLKINKDVKASIELLNSVGLTEAHLYIKRPDQISDGQKYRFAIAKLCDSEKPIWIADEFASTLNPEIAAVVAKGLRKMAYKYGTTLILSAPHTNYFIESLLPNKLVKLSWGLKATIYSIKILNFSHNGNRIQLAILNNGLLPLRNLQVGLIKMNGRFKLQRYFDCITPKQTVNITIKIREDKNFNALAIKSAEGVGDILYRK